MRTYFITESLLRKSEHVNKGEEKKTSQAEQ